MQRFRLMNFYVTGVVLLLVLAIASVAWLRRPETGAARADSKASAAGAALPSGEQMQGPAASAQGTQVSIDNFTFKPKDLSVSVGTTVTWVNRDDVPHTATSIGEPTVFDSKALDTDDKYSFTFTKPGTYKYYCMVHTHMTGTVTVK